MQEYTCDNCGGPKKEYPSRVAGKKRIFCSRKCYSYFREHKLPPEEQHAWKGGISAAESNRMYRQKNKDKIKAQNRARKLREIDAPGGHTKAQWHEVRHNKYNNTCAMDDETCAGSMTKDHIVPLVMGGSNDPSNLQPLCRSHNNRKRHQVYLGKFQPANPA